MPLTIHHTNQEGLARLISKGAQKPFRDMGSSSDYNFTLDFCF